MSASHPPIESIVPHGGCMRLLGAVVSHDDRETRCRVDAKQVGLFAEADGRVPSWVGVELMAQAIAAHGGLVARDHGESPRRGLFLGSRRIQLDRTHLDLDEELEVVVRHVRGEIGLTAFDCAVRPAGGDAPVASGRLNVYVARGDELGGPV